MIKEVLNPCEFKCPAGVNIKKYILLTAVGKFREAIETIRENNPLVSVCGAVCHEPCQKDCRRHKIDESISIREIKKFLSQQYFYIPDKKFPIKHKESIAIVGAGPAGLSAAYFLRKLGYQVTIFEREENLGGMLYYYIPTYRLPRNILMQDINYLRSIGIEIILNTTIGKDLSLKELTSTLVLLAVGLSKSKSLDIPSSDTSSVKILPSLEFLRCVNINIIKNNLDKLDGLIGEEVVVIGGGNVAVDAARTAKKIKKTASVSMVCLENADEMPAFPHEVTEAQKEGINILPSWGPRKIKGNCLEFIKCISVFDKGVFSPKFDISVTKYLPVDTIIIAIGQEPDEEFKQLIKEEGIKITYKEVRTNLRNVWACGDLVEGASSVVEAVASAKKLASEIDSFLSSEEMPQKNLIQLDVELPDVVIKNIKKMPKKEKILNIQDLIYEASRCLSCQCGAQLKDRDICCSCLNCLRVCPYELPSIYKDKKFSLEICQSCGLCKSICPVNGIYMQEEFYNLEWLYYEIEKKAPQKELRFCCLYSIKDDNNLLKDSNLLKDNNLLKEEEQNYNVINIACVGRIEVLHLLKVFEAKKAETIKIIPCNEQDCKFNNKTIDILLKKVNYVNRLLFEANLADTYKVSIVKE